MSNLEHIKELLYTGQRSAISTKDFESIIEQLETSQSRVKELEERLKILDEEAVVVEITEQEFEEYKKLERKLEIAEEALQYYADGEDMSEAKMQGSDAWRYIVDDNHTDTAQQALQKMKEVNRC